MFYYFIFFVIGGKLFITVKISNYMITKVTCVSPVYSFNDEQSSIICMFLVLSNVACISFIINYALYVILQSMSYVIKEISSHPLRFRRSCNAKFKNRN